MRTFEIAHTLEAADGHGEDRLLIADIGSRTVVAVADGAGGRSGAAAAAQMAVNFVKAHAAQLESRADCERLLSQMDHSIMADRDAGETTAVVVVLGPAGIVGASVGDSGAWIVSTGGIDDLTAAQARKPFVGVGTTVPVGFQRKSLRGTLLVATDGLLKYASRETIASTVERSDLHDTPAALVSLVRYASGALPDDVGIVVCRSSPADQN
jgi:serine/threonine protein phosphatase PrpC